MLFALLGPFVRLFALLSVQRYLGRQLLEKGLLDALTLCPPGGLRSFRVVSVSGAAQLGLF